MNIYSALKKDHVVIEKLLNELVESSEKGTDDWKGIIAQIRDELIPHARAEEALFYNPIRNTEHGGRVVLHSYQEHAMAETELRALQGMKAIDVNFKALAKKLRTDLLRHVEEEQSKVFAAAKVVFSDEDAESIGDAFEALKPQVKEQSLAGTSLDLILNMLPEGMRNKMRSLFSKYEKKAA